MDGVDSGLAFRVLSNAYGKGDNDHEVAWNFRFDRVIPRAGEVLPFRSDTDLYGHELLSEAFSDIAIDRGDRVVPSLRRFVVPSDV